MLLDELVRCLEVLQGRIRSHTAALQRNEAQTRLALIDPLLRALDWDVSDPGMVTPEYPVENGRNGSVARTDAGGNHPLA